MLPNSRVDAPADYAAWVDVLDGIEADLKVDQLLLNEEVAPAFSAHWEPPQWGGPMPAELQARAARILAQLDDSRTRLAKVRDATGQQLSAVRSIPGSGNDNSVYLDVAG